MDPIGPWTALVAAAPCAVGIAALIGALLAVPRRRVAAATRRRALGVVVIAVAVAGAAATAVAVQLGWLLGVPLAAGVWLLGAAAAVWLVRTGRGRPDDDGDDDDGPGGGGPPGGPDDGPDGGIDWAAFERQFWAHVHRRREPTR